MSAFAAAADGDLVNIYASREPFCESRQIACVPRNVVLSSSVLRRHLNAAGFSFGLPRAYEVVERMPFPPQRETRPPCHRKPLRLGAARSELDNHGVTPTELALAELVAEVGRLPGPVSPIVPILELGLSSMDALRLSEAIRLRFGTPLSAGDMLFAPCVR